MPSRKNKRRSARPSSKQLRGKQLTHQPFFPIVILTLILWFLYRSLFQFPVWFDEAIGKAIFFGLPVWLYVNVTGFRPIIDGFRLKKFKPGLMRGLALGGLFGFVTIFMRLWQNGWTLQAAPLFTSTEFWLEFILALLTAFWETIFFFSFITGVILDRFEHWSLAKQITLSSLIFLLFHIPNTFLRIDLVLVAPMLFLLALFAIGQALIYSQKENAYTLILTHALWGMVLLIYF